MGMARKGALKLKMHLNVPQVLLITNAPQVHYIIHSVDYAVGYNVANKTCPCNLEHLHRLYTLPSC